MNDRLVRRSAARGGLWLLIGLFVFIFLGLHAWNLSNRFVEFKWDGAALGYYSHQLWNLAHGTASSADAAFAGAWYQTPVVLRVLAPLYQLWPNPLFLPIVQTAALAVTAVIIFFTSGLFVSKTRAFILTLLFCFYPPVYAICTASFHPSLLALPFLALAIQQLVSSRAVAAGVLSALMLLFDLRAGLMAIPLCLWAARRSHPKPWTLLAGILAAAGILGWRSSGSDEGIGPFMVIAALAAPYLIWALCALERWADRTLSKRSLVLALISPVFFAGVVCASAIITPSMMEAHPGVSRMPVRQSAMTTLLERVPADAQVLTTPVFLPAFSNRTGVGLLGDTEMPSAYSERPRFALAELGGAKANLDQAEGSAEAIRELTRQGWGAVEEAGGVVLFSERPGAAARELYVPRVDLSADQPYLFLGAEALGAIELIGFTMSPDESDPDLIRFSFYWKKLKSGSEAFAPQISVIGPDGRSVYSVQRLMCYGLYPLGDWKTGEVVKDNFLFVVPDQLQGSAYEVRLGLLSRPGSRPVALSSPVDGALDQEGRVRLIALDAI